MPSIPYKLTQLQQKYQAFIGRPGLSKAPYPKNRIDKHGWIVWKPFPSMPVEVISPVAMRTEWQQYQAGQAAGTSAGGGGPGTAGGPGQASGVAPAFTGGAESVEPEIVDNNVRLTDRGRKFRGIDTFTPDELQPIEKSPFCVNWNAIERAGSWCARRGTGRFIDDGTTCEDSGASPITSTHRGLAILPLPLNDPSDGNATHTTAMLLCFSNVGPGNSGNINFCVVEPDVAWGKIQSMRNFPGPHITLSKPGALTLRVAATYATTLFATRVAAPRNFVKGITIAWSAIRQPRDVDKRDDFDDSKEVTLDQDRASWNGVAQNFDITVPATGFYFVTVWAHSLEGTSEPSYGVFEVT